MSSPIITYNLPFPPSTNTYWRRRGARFYIAKAGQAFRANVLAVIFPTRPKRLTQLLAVEVDLYPPKDGRLRDLDNFDGKALFDALAHAGVFENDRQIKKRTGEIFPPIARPGKVIVRLYEYQPKG